MLADFFITPLIYLSAFFRDFYFSGNQNHKRRVVTNIVFSTLISLVYGFLIGVYLVIFYGTFFNPQIKAVWAPIIINIIFMLIVHFIMVIRLNQNSSFLLPEIYLSILLLGVYIYHKKYFLKNIMKFIGIGTLLFIVLLTLFMSLTIDENYIVPVTLTSVFISFTVTFLLLNTINLDDLKKIINQFLLYFNLAIMLFSFSIIRLFLNRDYFSIATWIDIGILLISILFVIPVLPPLAIKAYVYFNDTYRTQLLQYWTDIQEKYGYTKCAKYVLKEIDFVKEGIKEIRIIWITGKKKLVIKRFCTGLSVLIIGYSFIYFMSKYQYEIQNYMGTALRRLYSLWVQRFKGNKNKANMYLMLIINVIAIVLISWSTLKKIRMKRDFSEIFMQILRLIFAFMWLVFILLAIDIIEHRIGINVVCGLSVLLCILSWVHKKWYSKK